jgi:HSP20 family protein
MSYDPTEDIRSFVDNFDRFFTRMVERPSGSRLLPIDVVETADKWVLRAAVPGVSPEELDINIENNVLTIRGESRLSEEFQDSKVYRQELAYGVFTRSIRLPNSVDVDQVEADFTNGMVTISLPKVVEVKPVPIKVPIKQVTASSESAEQASSN